MDNQRKSNSATRELNHPAFQNIRVCLVSLVFDVKLRRLLPRRSTSLIRRRTVLQTENANGVQQPMTVITLSKLITPQAMQQCLQFIYTGSLDKRYHDLQVRWLGREKIVVRGKGTFGNAGGRPSFYPARETSVNGNGRGLLQNERKAKRRGAIYPRNEVKEKKNEINAFSSFDYPRGYPAVFGVRSNFAATFLL